MLLTIKTTHQPATDLGFLLHKSPERVHETRLNFGTARMFYAEASETACTFALVLDVDPVTLVRGKDGSGGKGRQSGPLDQYVNDRPYVASSLMSVAIARGLRNALGGKSKERQALADTAIPIEARLMPLPVRGSEQMLTELFAPLGYDISTSPIPLDETWPDWGPSPYVALDLAATCRLRDLLAHLYVLIPVLDKQKHYYVARDELQKLLEKGEGWLARHPAKELIAARYLGYRKSMVAQALERLADDAIEDELEQPAAGDGAPDSDEWTSPDLVESDWLLDLSGPERGFECCRTDVA